MVRTDAGETERELRAGNLVCPGCEGELRPWGFTCPRSVRLQGASIRIRSRRSRCGECRRTHLLLHTTLLARRKDEAETIGAALLAKAAGKGHRTIARDLRRPAMTVRNWLRRATTRADAIRDHFTRLAHQLGADLRLEPRGSPLADALEVMGIAARAAAEQFGPALVWRFASGATAGRLLSNTL
jgi:hypothetical protein